MYTLVHIFTRLHIYIRNYTRIFNINLYNVNHYTFSYSDLFYNNILHNNINNIH